MVLCAAVILFSVGSFIAVKTLHDRNFQRSDRPQFSAYLRYEDVPEYNRKIVQFKSGKNTLTGYIYGEGTEKGLIVLAHGLGAGAESYLPQIIYFLDKGWAVFTYDSTGNHASEGKSMVGLAQSLLDLDAALTYVKGHDKLNHLPVMLFGHSWGGYAVASVLNYGHPVTAVASVAGYNSPMEILFEQAKDIMGPFAHVTYPFMWLYQNMLFGKTALAKAVDGINKTAVPVMIIHGDADNVISYTGAATIAHRNEITNPNVVYKTCSKEGHNGHSNLFFSEATMRYRAEKNQEYKELDERYGGDIPDNIKAAYYEGIDRFRSSELDSEFMDEINEFFERALETYD
jgi:pimeloyl-ACP methyl ester carboxylesterase